MAFAAEKYGMPPLAPEGVTVSVPAAVTGEPLVVNTLFAADRPTLLTPPPPGA